MRVDIFHKNANVWRIVSGHFSTEVNLISENEMLCAGEQGEQLF